MPKIQTSCPQCRQPLVADINQVIDVARNPQLKQVLLSGGLNYAQCQLCGFKGLLPVPIVYHDADKELLLTFSPPTINKTMEEKESALAPLLKDIIDNLDPKDRKGYLFQPKSMLTMNSLIKNVLLADGITEEMIKDQQEKMTLLDQLFSMEGEQLKKTIVEKNQQIDKEFFALFAEIAQRILASRDEKAVKKIKELQDILMAETDIGKEILAETQEIQAAQQSLEKLGNNLTRSSLLELIIQAPNTLRIKAFASLVRPAMDYQFFQLFTEKIEKSSEDQRNDLVEKRNFLLKITQEIDQQIEERISTARENINSILSQENPQEALLQNIALVDQYFIQALSVELESAEKNKDADRKKILEELFQKIQELSTPPELKMVEQLISAADDDKKLEEIMNGIQEGELTQLIDYLTSIVNQYDEQIKISKDKELEELKVTYQKLAKVYNLILRRSMKNKYKAN